MQHLSSKAWVNTRQHQMQKGLMQIALAFFFFPVYYIQSL